MHTEMRLKVLLSGTIVWNILDLQYDSFNYRYWSRIPEVNYVEMFVSIRGVPTYARLSGLDWRVDGRPWSRGSRYGRPPDIPKTPWGPERRLEIHSKGSVSYGFAPRDHRRPLEGKRWPRGHGRHYKIKGYRVRYPQIPDPSRKSGQSDARDHVASVDVVLSWKSWLKIEFKSFWSLKFPEQKFFCFLPFQLIEAESSHIRLTLKEKSPTTHFSAHSWD